METYRETVVTIPAVSLDTLIAILSEDDPKAAGELLLREQPNLIETLRRGSGPSMNSKELSGRQHFAIPQLNGSSAGSSSGRGTCVWEEVHIESRWISDQHDAESSRLEVPETAKW